MEARVELPDAVMHQIEVLAVDALPLIPSVETGPVRPVTGSELDEMFAREERALTR